MVVDSLAPCRYNAGSVCNPGTAAAEAEERKIDKYKDLVNDGYLFQPLAFEIQGEVVLKKLCKNLSICTEERRAGSFLKQCDIRPEWTKMQTKQFRGFSSEPSELAILKE